MRKTAVIAAVRNALEAELRALVAAASLALDEATSEESKAENKYDTRSLKASYLWIGKTNPFPRHRSRLRSSLPAVP